MANFGTDIDEFCRICFKTPEDIYCLLQRQEKWDRIFNISPRSKAKDAQNQDIADISGKNQRLSASEKLRGNGKLKLKATMA